MSASAVASARTTRETLLERLAAVNFTAVDRTAVLELRAKDMSRVERAVREVPRAAAWIREKAGSAVLFVVFDPFAFAFMRA